MFKDYSFVHVNMSELSNSEKRTLNTFLNSFQNSPRTLVFRGEERHKELYGCEDMTEVLHRIFMIGAKGEHFWKQRSKYITKTICKKTFEKLFSEYRKILLKENITSTRTKGHLLHFKKTNKDFCDFFINTHNIDYMWSVVNTLNQKERRLILNYYLAVLHGIGHIALNGSPLLSTSTDFNIAKKYQQKGIIYIAWINDDKELVQSYDINNNNAYIKKYNLPTCTVSVFPEDDEICISYGLLPHKIIGVVHDNYFYVNPNLFNKTRILEEVLKFGFDIDQESFNDVLRLTKYKRAFDVVLINNSVNDIEFR